MVWILLRKMLCFVFVFSCKVLLFLFFIFSGQTIQKVFYQELFYKVDSSLSLNVDASLSLNFVPTVWWPKQTFDNPKQQMMKNNEMNFDTLNFVTNKLQGCNSYAAKYEAPSKVLQFKDWTFDTLMITCLFFMTLFL